MNRRGVWTVMLVMASLLVMPKAWGQRPPDQDPANHSQSIVLSWDRSSMPGTLDLIPSRTVFAYERATTLDYGRFVYRPVSNSGYRR